ncbi:hypothetical protein G7Z17_g9088 [Cylindrodendrum hubeiense]|uniref:Zn(2)-C6 fungal-type domain-containing protein n=1 Tax=Cylindrodendrum hubeiense TaxID=595255 RepID=A0A9P5LDP5_9HYPO|nr:hypothetical protein G7Z17_g9088 [Cylindrodendrum hubeiense]
MDDHDGQASQQLGFLPVNQSNSPPESKQRRAYLSCERCRKRKSRCEPLPEQPQVCKRCATDNHPCEFRTSRSVKRKASTQFGSAEPETRQAHSWSHHEEAGQLQDPLSPIDQSSSVSTANHVGATVEGFGSGEIVTPSSNAALDARTRLVSTHIHNTSDALDLLTFAATGSQGHHNHSAAHVDESHTPPIDASIHDAANDAKKIAAAWNGFVLIRRGVVSQQEVVEYLDFFFECLWPLKPVIPSYYRNKVNYSLLALEEPLLLTCIVTLASRYFNLSGGHGEIRSERIHWRSWLLLQRFLQSVMWGSNTTRSIGAIASMLLLIDWHVKAINNPMDFTEGEEAINFVDDSATSFKTSPNDADSLTGQRRYGMTSLMEKLNIVSPAYRSNKMSWILLSNAIALAHEGCCFEYEPPSATTKMSEAETVRQEWSRLVCVFIYLTDEGLATRLGLEPLLPEKSRQVVRDQYSTTFADSLQDSMLWEGYFELFVEARKGREFLHSLKKTGASLSNQNLVPNLERLGRALNRWERQYHHRHTQALQSSSTSATTGNAAVLSNFAEQAAQASHALLSVVVEILEPARLIAYLPVKYWLFIVAASLHLLKHVSVSDPDIHLLRSVIEAIRLGSADDAHMAMRFSKFLGIVLQASLPTSIGQSSGTGQPEADAQALGSFQMVDDFSGGAFGSALDDGGIWDIPINLDVVSDPTTWWDSFSGRNGFSRFT